MRCPVVFEVGVVEIGKILLVAFAVALYTGKNGVLLSMVLVLVMRVFFGVFFLCSNGVVDVALVLGSLKVVVVAQYRLLGSFVVHVAIFVHCLGRFFSRAQGIRNQTGFGGLVRLRTLIRVWFGSIWVRFLVGGSCRVFSDDTDVAGLGSRFFFHCFAQARRVNMYIKVVIGFASGHLRRLNLIKLTGAADGKVCLDIEYKQ